MATYDPTEHPALSAAARRPEPEELQAQADTAEAVLGLVGTSYEVDRATLAVVHQVNHQVELGPEGLAYASMGRGARSWSMREGDPAISPLARSIVRGLAPWTVATGLR